MIIIGIGGIALKKYIIKKLMNAIANNDTYDQDQLDRIAYGLEAIYILITKLIIISIIAILLGIFKEFVIFLLIYNIIRMTSFGLHATKSWICLVFSIIIFLGAPIIAIITTIPLYVKVGIGTICTYFMYKNAPADTEKRPIINLKRRLVYKWLSVAVCISMLIISFVCQDQFIANAFLLAVVVQCFMISPTVYKLFKLPYNNYLKYQTTGANI